MVFKRKQVLILAAALVFALSTTVLAAPRSFTIKGRVVDPEGRPVVGAPLQIVPHIPGGGWDSLNNFYKIPNYSWHQTLTDANGEFIMENVLDYPENYTHRYVIVARNGYNGLHITQLFTLQVVREVSVLEFPIKAQYATKLVVSLTDSAGKPFNGKKVLFVQAGRKVGDPIHGTSFIIEAEFKNGIYQRSSVVKPDGYGRVAILDFANEQQAEDTLLGKGLMINESLDGLAYVLKNSQGRPVSAETSYVRGGETRIELQLP